MRREFLEVTDEVRIDPPTQQTSEQPESKSESEPEPEPERADKTKPADEPKGSEVG
jgi:hypothetical protein